MATCVEQAPIEDSKYLIAEHGQKQGVSRMDRNRRRFLPKVADVSRRQPMFSRLQVFDVTGSHVTQTGADH